MKKENKKKFKRKMNSKSSILRKSNGNTKKKELELKKRRLGIRFSFFNFSYFIYA